MMTVPEPPITMSPWLPPVSINAAFLPLMNTVVATPETSALPHVQVSPLRAAARPSKNTSEDPEAMALAPCPGIGQVVGSVTRAAGLAMHDSLSAIKTMEDFIRVALEEDARTLPLLADRRESFTALINRDWCHGPRTA